ncbi:helix-turn-helix domain-containing protein [Blautia sp. NSJ-34]|uniref:Helix-turn-helix domain-containing protein n=1 Tax=Blautia celeris TaxID=2763026 RepID=A0ABR7FK67_9FIRM|nr:MULTISPECIES: XRE family transcriptional regulator [Blautia]MBC5675615.1 helix-turn-helix domain-containing protein [Blautia celeris]
MDMGEKIKFLRLDRNMTLEELGNKVGVGKSTVRKWETGMIANMKRDKILKVAEALDTSPAYLMGWDNNVRPIENGTKEKKRGVTINVLGRVAAGIPIEAIEDIIDTEEISEEMASTGEYFGLKIHGNSMEPRIMDSDVVIVKRQDDAESGDIIIATINGDEATCKRLRKLRDGIELISNNPSYNPIFFDNREIIEKPVRILGKVVELRGKF